jgi:acetylglutamate kinase
VSSVVLLKIGGRAFDSADGLSELAAELKSLPEIQPVIVHGGGTEISQALRQAQREPVFVDGLRVTTSADMYIVEDVLSNQINSRIALLLEKSGIKCQRLSGKSQGLLIVEPMFRNGKSLGQVGNIINVHPECVLQTLANASVPIVSPVSVDKAGTSYNVNADNAAGAIAAALRCDHLVFFTDVDGVQVNGSTCKNLTIDQAKGFIAEDIIKGGMIAKMESIFAVLQAGVARVHIARWDGPGTLKNILNETSAKGTVVTKG